ncbi:MAG: hypothetical protein JWQ78_1033 [Sediminibacterium sp.]|nr:hypothetical protein [Sediminibacterium sp.]
MFDFDDPDFYPKFVKGKLNYFLAVFDLPSFLYEYQVTNRSVTEQQLQLPANTKQALRIALDSNLAGNNRFYKYDFLYDNCTTRVRDLLVKHAGMKVHTRLALPGTSFRDMIHEYLDRGGMAWTKLGMDLLLGSPADKAVSIDESMFLPDYLLKGVDSAAGSILWNKRVIISATAGHVSRINWPLYIFAFVSLAILLISTNGSPRARRVTRFFDLVLFSLTGIIGLFLLFTWFGTDHGSFAANYNLLWALPTNIVAAVALGKRPAWLSKYFFATSLIYGFVLACFFWLPQQLNTALIPLVIVLFARSARLTKG